jgi:hypothetical protein
LYTCNGTVEEVISYIAGLDACQENQFLGGFNCWLCQTKSLKNHDMWQKTIMEDQRRQGRIEDFYSVFSEFVKTEYGYSEKDYTIDFEGHHLFGDKI